MAPAPVVLLREDEVAFGGIVKIAGLKGLRARRRVHRGKGRANGVAFRNVAGLRYCAGSAAAFDSCGMAGSKSLSSPGLLPRGSWAANCLMAALGLLALGLGSAMLALGGVLTLVQRATADTASAPTARPVVRTQAELDAWPPGTELLLEGRAQHALFPPDLTLPGARHGLLTWREDRFAGREPVPEKPSQEVWTTVDTVCPTLALTLRGAPAPVLIGAHYRLLDPITRVQSDTPAVRPSPRAGPRGTWRFTGVRVGERVTVALRTTSAAVGASLPMRADELRPGTAADWRAADDARQQFGSGFRGLMLGLGAALVVVGAGIWVVGWRQRRALTAETNAPAA